MTTRLPSQKCLACGYAVDAHSGVRDENAEPDPGDVAVCIQCGMVMVFNRKLRFRLPTQDELRFLAQHIDVQRAVKAVGDLNKQKRT